MLKQVYNINTRGPRGPWVAHLRKTVTFDLFKRSKVTVELIIENPRGII